VPAGRSDQSNARLARSRSTKGPVAPEEPPRAIHFGPLDEYLGFYLRRLYDAYHAHFVAEVGDMDVQPREVGALFVIALNPGLTPSRLGAAVQLDRSQITSMLNLFEGRGILERRVAASDGRSRQVYLTPEGEKMLGRLREFVATFDRSFSGHALTDEELEQLVSLLAKLLAATQSRSAGPD